MNIIDISKQKIFNRDNSLFGYELEVKDGSNESVSLSSNIKGTTQLIISSFSSYELDKLFDRNIMAFLRVDEETLLKGILDVLDHKRFILSVSEDIDLSDKVVSKIIQYKKRGFKLSIEHFDSTTEMIQKFHRLFNFVDIIKMDIVLSEADNLEKVMSKFKDRGIKLLAENIETKEEHKKYINMGFDYLQGYYLDKPEIMEVIQSKEPSQIIILQLINIIKNDNSTEELELFIRKQPDLSFKLVQFFNNSKKFDVKIKSLTQVITLMGRGKLLRWLILYLYSEASKNYASKTVLALAIKRAERMESEAREEQKDKAYLAGMFSMLSSIFGEDIKILMNHIKMDNDIISLVLKKKGIFAGSLIRAEEAEKEYLKKIMLANFEKLNTTDLIYALEDSGVEIDKDKL